MDASWIKGLTVGAVIATTGGAIAGYNMLEQPTFAPPEFAEVTNVVPATEQVEVSREVCEDVEVTQQQEPRDKRRLMGTATGALVGGLLGNQVGSGSGKAVATVVGAAAGGIAGNKIQERAQADDTYTTVETRCETVVEHQEQVVGYEVTYRIGAEEGQVRMDSDPGERIPLVNGELPQKAGA